MKVCTGAKTDSSRMLAARQLGIAEIPVMVAAGWTEAQKRAYVLADNQLAITGSGWDPELLRLELGELKLSGFDLSLTGFGELELKDIMAERTAILGALSLYLNFINLFAMLLQLLGDQTTEDS